MSLTRGKAHNTDEAYTTDEKIEIDLVEDGSLESLRNPEKFDKQREERINCAYNIRRKK